MAYAQFDTTKPDWATQTGTQLAQSIRDNERAVRDMVASGTLIGFSGAASGGTAEQPTTILHSKSAERIRETITWGSAGGAAGNPSTILYEYSSTSGSSYDTIGTITFTYDGSGNCTAWSWS